MIWFTPQEDSHMDVSSTRVLRAELYFCTRIFIIFYSFLVPFVYLSLLSDLCKFRVLSLYNLLDYFPQSNSLTVSYLPLLILYFYFCTCLFFPVSLFCLDSVEVDVFRVIVPSGFLRSGINWEV